jgi:ubiquinone/menaquinone biosynthesis C-methylase UbiE
MGLSTVQDEQTVKGTFQKIWSEADLESMVRLSPMDEEIAHVVLRNLPAKADCRILEAGSGSGKVSVQIAQAGHVLTLLDICQEALEISKQVFRLKQCGFRAICASMFSMPVHDRSFDVVWNAGVIEHFYYAEQVKALSEMARVLKPGGMIITLNPSHRGWLYRWGKYRMEKSGIWPYGQEFPVTSLGRHCRDLGLRLVAEREVLPEFQYLFHGERGARLFRACQKFPLLKRLTGGIFGGYLKLSLIQNVA